MTAENFEMDLGQQLELDNQEKAAKEKERRRRLGQALTLRQAGRDDLIPEETRRELDDEIAYQEDQRELERLRAETPGYFKEIDREYERATTPDWMKPPVLKAFKPIKAPTDPYGIAEIDKRQNERADEEHRRRLRMQLQNRDGSLPRGDRFLSQTEIEKEAKERGDKGFWSTVAEEYLTAGKVLEKVPVFGAAIKVSNARQWSEMEKRMSDPDRYYRNPDYDPDDPFSEEYNDLYWQDQELLTQRANKQAVEEARERAHPIRAMGGKIAAEMPTFAGEMALTSGLATRATGSLVHATKLFKAAAASQGIKWLSKKVGRGIVLSAIQSTLMPQRTLEAYQRFHADRFAVTQDELGQLDVIMTRHGDSTALALWKGWLDTFKEVLSEHSGELLAFGAGKAISRWGERAAKKAAERAASRGLGVTGQLFTETPMPKRVARVLLQMIGEHDGGGAFSKLMSATSTQPMFEGVEERFGGALEVLFGIDEREDGEGYGDRFGSRLWHGFWPGWDQIRAEAVGFMPTMLLGGGAAVVGDAVRNFQDRPGRVISSRERNLVERARRKVESLPTWRVLPPEVKGKIRRAKRFDELDAAMDGATGWLRDHSSDPVVAKAVNDAQVLGRKERRDEQQAQQEEIRRRVEKLIESLKAQASSQSTQPEEEAKQESGAEEQGAGGEGPAAGTPGVGDEADRLNAENAENEARRDAVEEVPAEGAVPGAEGTAVPEGAAGEIDPDNLGVQTDLGFDENDIASYGQTPQAGQTAPESAAAGATPSAAPVAVPDDGAPAATAPREVVEQRLAETGAELEKFRNGEPLETDDAPTAAVEAAAAQAEAAAGGPPAPPGGDQVQAPGDQAPAQRDQAPAQRDQAPKQESGVGSQGSGGGETAAEDRYDAMSLQQLQGEVRRRGLKPTLRILGSPRNLRDYLRSADAGGAAAQQEARQEPGEARPPAPAAPQAEQPWTESYFGKRRKGKEPRRRRVPKEGRGYEEFGKAWMLDELRRRGRPVPKKHSPKRLADALRAHDRMIEQGQARGRAQFRPSVPNVPEGHDAGEYPFYFDFVSGGGISYPSDKLREADNRLPKSQQRIGGEWDAITEEIVRSWPPALRKFFHPVNSYEQLSDIAGAADHYSEQGPMRFVSGTSTAEQEPLTPDELVEKLVDDAQRLEADSRSAISPAQARKNWDAMFAAQPGTRAVRTSELQVGDRIAVPLPGIDRTVELVVRARVNGMVQFEEIPPELDFSASVTDEDPFFNFLVEADSDSAQTMHVLWVANAREIEAAERDGVPDRAQVWRMSKEEIVDEMGREGMEDFEIGSVRNTKKELIAQLMSWRTRNGVAQVTAETTGDNASTMREKNGTLRKREMQTEDWGGGFAPGDEDISFDPSQWEGDDVEFQRRRREGRASATDSELARLAKRLGRALGVRVEISAEPPEWARRRGAPANANGAADLRHGRIWLRRGAADAETSAHEGAHLVQILTEALAREGDSAAKAAAAKFLEAIEGAPETVRKSVKARYGGQLSPAELFAVLFEEEQAGRLQGLVEGPNAKRGLAAWWTRVKRLFSQVWQAVRRTMGRPLKLGDVAAMDWPDAIRELNKALRAGQRIVGEDGRALDAAAGGRGGEGADVLFKQDGTGPTAEETAEAERQYKAVEARFTNPDGTKKKGWMKAPNGKDTKLSERAWVQTRTENFKRWFGDWEDAATVRAAFDFCMNGKAVSSLSGDEFAPTGKNDLVDRVAAFFASEYGGKAESPELGTVILDRRGVKDSLSHGMGRSKAAAYAAVHDVIEHGKVFDTRENWKGRGADTFVIAAPVVIGGRDYVCEVVVERNRESGRQAFYLHEVNVKEKIAGAIKTSTREAAPATSAAPVRSILVQRMQEIKEKGAEVSRAVDENGEPLVVYHGSHHTHTVFDNRESDSRNGSPDGVSFFTDSREVADSYAPDGRDVEFDEKKRPFVDVKFKDGRVERQYYDLGGVYAVFLSMQNPLVVDAAGAEWSRIPFEGSNLTTNEIAKIAKDRGYDGVIFRNVVDGAAKHKPSPSTTYAVFSPQKIKSSTDNVGTYSERDDIRWSRRGVAREASGQGLLDFGEDVLDGYAERKGISAERRPALKEGVKKAQRFAQTARNAWERAFRIGSNAEDWGRAFATKEANRGEYPTVSRVLRELYERKESFGAEVRGLRLESAEDVAGMMMALRSPFQEMFKVVFVDGQNRVLDARVVHIGAITTSLAHPTNVLGDVPDGAQGFYISHNHPSGDPTPSSEDARITERFREAGRLLGLRMHDHVVTDGERYYTFALHQGFTLPAEKQSHEAWEIGTGQTTQQVRNPITAAQVAALARQGAKVPVVLALGNKADIRAVRLLPEGFFDGQWDLRSARTARAIFGHALDTTAVSVILVVPEGTVQGRNAHRFVGPIIEAGRTLGIGVVDVIEDRPAADTGFRSYHADEPAWFSQAAESGAREAREGGEPPADGERRLPSRAWPADFPNVVVHTTRQAVERRHATDFARAKAGDWDAAARIVRAVVKIGRVKEIAARHPGAIVVPVNAAEATGNNRIPYAYACLLADAGLELGDDIVQSVKANHTGAEALDRLLRRAEFAGPVEAGREYILVDDHVTQGGTLNELRHYIEERGGKVVEITTLTASKGSTILPIRRDTVAALKAKFGPELDHGLQAAKIAGRIEALTESEGRYLLKLSPDTFRNRIASAGLQEGAEAAGLQRPVQVREADGGDTGAEGLGGLENLDNLDNRGEGGRTPSTRPSRVTPEEDAAYLAAVERGDMETAGRMVRMAAERAGYSDDASWRMSHHAPNRETAEGGSAIRMSDAGTDADRLMPKDAWTHPEWYFNMNDPMERESYYIIAAALREEERHRAAGDGKHAHIMMYRGVDKSRNRRESTFRNGDWCTPSRAYALREARENPGGGRVIEMRVSLANLYWDGNSISEFGYDNGKDLAYRDTKNNRKLLDPVTRDVEGNVIPLSRRFDKTKSSIRFSIGGLYTGSAADYAHRREDGTVENGPSLHYIGRGEGNQAYGWGLYASDRRGVAESYAKRDYENKDPKWNSTAVYHGEKVVGNHVNPALSDEANSALGIFMAAEGDLNKAVEVARHDYEEQEGVWRSFAKKVLDFIEQHGKEFQYIPAPEVHRNVYEQTFFNNRANPEETERHLLKWYGDVTSEQFRWVTEQLKKERSEGPVKRFLDDWELDDEALDDDYFLTDVMEEHTGKGLYRVLEDMFGSPKAASEFLARAGIDGVKYPVNSFRKNVKDGDVAGWNYVSFRDDNIRVDHKWRDGKMEYQRGSTEERGAGRERLEAAARALEKALGVTVEVSAEMPEWAREQSKGAKGEIRAAIDPATGRVWLSSRLADEGSAAHEGAHWIDAVVSAAAASGDAGAQAAAAKFAEIVANCPEALREKIRERYGEVTDSEIFAHMAEAERNGELGEMLSGAGRPARTWWQKVKRAFALAWQELRRLSGASLKASALGKMDWRDALHQMSEAMRTGQRIEVGGARGTGNLDTLGNLGNLGAAETGVQYSRGDAAPERNLGHPDAEEQARKAEERRQEEARSPQLPGVEWQPRASRQSVTNGVVTYDDADLVGMGEWFTAKIQEYKGRDGKSRWAVRGADGKVYIGNIGTEEQAKWYLGHRRAELARSVDALAGASKETVVRIADARKAFIEEMARQDASKADKVEAVHQLMRDLKIPDELWKQEADAVMEILREHPIYGANVAAESARRFVDTVLAREACRKLKREIKKAFKKHSGRPKYQGGPPANEAYGMKAARKWAFNADGLTQQQLEAEEERLAAEAKMLEDKLHDLDIGDTPSSEAQIAQWRLMQCYAEMAAIRHVGGLFTFHDPDAKTEKRADGMPARDYSGDLAAWYQGLEYVKKLVEQSAIDRYRSEAEKQEAADADREKVIDELLPPGTKRIDNINDLKILNSRPMKALHDICMFIKLNIDAGFSLGEQLVYDKKVGFGKGTAGGMIEEVAEAQREELQRNEDGMNAILEVFGRHFGVNPTGSLKERFEFDRRLAETKAKRRGQTDVKKRKLVNNKDGSYSVELVVAPDGKPECFEQSLAELMPVILWRRQAEEAAGCSYEDFINALCSGKRIKARPEEERRFGMMRGLARTGLLPETIDEAEKLLRKKNLLNLTYAISELFDRGYEELDLMVRYMYGGALTKVAYYCPAKREYYRQAGPAGPAGLESFMSMLASFVRERTDNSRTFEMYDIFDQLLDDARRKNHMITHYRIVDHVRRVFQHPEMQRALIQRFGEKTKRLIDNYWNTIARGTSREVDDWGTFMRKVRTAYAASQIPRLTTVVKQMTSSPATMALMPEDMTATQFCKWMAVIQWPKERKRYAALMNRYLPDWRFRLGGRINQAMQSVMDSDDGIRLRGYMRAAKNIGAKVVSWGDARACVTGTYPIYRYWHDKLVAEGKSEDDANREAMRKVSQAFNETQQSALASYMGAIQTGRIWVWAAMFKSSPIAYTRLFYAHARALAQGRGKPMHHIRSMLGLLVANSLFLVAGGSLFAGRMFGSGGDDDDDDDGRIIRKLFKTFGRAAIELPTAGLPGGSLAAYLWDRFVEHKNMYGRRPVELDAPLAVLNRAIDIFDQFWNKKEADGFRVADDLADVVGAITQLPIPGLFDITAGTLDAFTADDLNVPQRIGRSLGYSRSAVEAPRKD